MQRNAPIRGMTIKYCLLQGTFWMAYCAIYSFAVEFLLAKGFAAGRIGVVLALSSITTSLLQPVLAAASERYGKPTPGAIALTGVGLAMALSLVLGFLQGPAVAVVFCVLAAIMQSLLPFLNAIGFAYMNRGEKLNYGLARASGSMFFALISAVLGFFVAHFGGAALPFLNIALLALFAVLIWVVGEPDWSVQSRRGAEPTPLVDFLTRYRRFCILLVGLTCMLFQHSIINSYLTQIFEGVGGSSVDKGVALAVAAISELPTMMGFSLLTKKFTIRSLMRFAAIFLSVKALWFPLATSVLSLHLAHLVQMVSYALYIPASLYYVNSLMAERDRVKGVALINVPMTLGSVFGTLVGGWLLQTVGLRAMLVTSAVVSVVGCVIVCLSLENVQGAGGKSW